MNPFYDQQKEIGLYYYVARWYDPYLNHFAQADTIVPSPNNPQDWNGYNYTRFNPVAYSDPTGNRPCNGENSGSGVCDQVTKDDLLGVLKWSFGWTTKGSFTKKEIGIILEAGNEIANYMSTLTGNWGQGWIRTHLGNAVFRQNETTKTAAEKIKASAFVFPFHDVILRRGYYDVYTITHELGHVLDNNNQSGTSGLYPATFVGGGPADAMVTAMGGDPTMCNPRLQCWSAPFVPHGYDWYMKKVAGIDPWPIEKYGNNGVADDFAETFARTILYQSAPSSRMAWMINYLASWR